MEIKYTVKVSILNKLNNEVVDFSKPFSYKVVNSDSQLYDNIYEIWHGYIIDLLREQVNVYLYNENITEDDIEVEGYEIWAEGTNVDIFFENSENPNEYTLTPTIKAYVHPKEVILEPPTLKGELVNSTAIAWSWEGDKKLAHYLLDEKNDIIAQLPMGLNEYVETQLELNTVYIRKLVSYNDSSTSNPSDTVTIMTGSENNVSELHQYECKKNEYDPYSNIDDTMDLPLLEAFHSGIGDGKDCLVTKQTAEDFYEKFGLDMKLFATYHKAKSVYDQVSFNYRIHATGQFETYEQNGELDLVLNAYPIEYITYRVYRYGLREISANMRVKCQVKYYKLVAGGTDSTGGTLYIPKAFTKTLTSDSIEFKFKGTATFDDKDIENVGFAICDFLEYSNAKTIGSKSILQIIQPKIDADTEIKNGTSETGIPYTTFDFQVENDYPFDEATNLWSNSAARPFGSGVRGTLKTSAGTSSTGLDKNSLPRVYGFSEGCLCEIQQFITNEINYLDGTKATLNKSEITTANLINIVDSSVTLSSTDSSIKNVVTLYTKERDIIVDTLDATGTSSVISKCHIDPNGVSSQFESERLTYTFSSDDPYTMVVGCYVIKGIDMSFNNDPVTDMPLTTWRPREYMFVPKIMSTSGNIDLGLYENVRKGQTIAPYRGYGYFGVSLFANTVVVLNDWETTLPKYGTDALNGIVNGRFDLSPSFMGKKDLLVTMPVFQIPSYILPDTVRYDVILSDVRPKTGFVSSSFAHRDSNNYGIKNADVITFSSDSMFDKVFEYTNLIETIKHNGLEMHNEFQKSFDFKIKKPLTGDLYNYETYTLQIISDNNNIAVDAATLAVKFNSKEEFDFTTITKYQQNSTDHWYPRVHNGYYYLNNEEHFVYSEFNADGDFTSIPRFISGEVHFTINCELRKNGGVKKQHTITRKQEHEFIKDRILFDFDTKSGLLFPQPTLNTKYYKEYSETTYLSSTIVIPETVAACDIMSWISDIPGESSMTVQLRSYDISQSDNGIWSDWITMTSGGGTELLLNSSVVQFRVIFKPVTTNVYQDFVETKCCQLDYTVDEIDVASSSNIRLDNDIIQCKDTGKSATVYSEILDYGYSASLSLDTFDNGKGISIYIAGSDSKSSIKNSPSWRKVNGSTTVGRYRYLRYRIDMPAGAEIYLLYKSANQPVTTAYVPKIGNVVMKFTHIEPDHTYAFSQEFDYVIPFDAEWHQVADSITDLIKPVITDAGYDMSDVENIVIDSKDNVSEIRFDQIVASTNETAEMIEIFNSWHRFSHNTTNNQPAIPSELTAWSYDPVLDSVVCQINSNSYIGFVSDRKYDKYKHKVTVASTNSDDDMIGVVIAFAVDSAGKEHTLSAIRTSNVSNQDMKNSSGVPVQWGIFYDYTGFGAKKLIADGSAHVTLATKSWSGNPKGATISVQRSENKIIAKTSQLNASNIDDNTVLTVDLDSDPLLSVFKGPCQYGYSCASQNSSSFKDIEFVNLNALDGGIDVRSLKKEYDVARKSQYVNFINNSCTLSEVPQQFCPVVVQDDGLGPLLLTAFYDSEGKATLTNVESFISNGQRNFNLCYTEIDERKLVVKLDDKVVDKSKYKLYKNIIKFNEDLSEGHSIEVSYMLRNSFAVNPDIEKNTTKITANTDIPLVTARVMYETNKIDNKDIITNLSFNPIHNVDSKGFVYISYDTFPVHDFSIYSNPSVLKGDGRDTTQVYISVVDSYGNPVPGETLKITNVYGKMDIEDLMTDENGVVSLRYTAPNMACRDTITVKCTSIDLTRTLTITNK